MPDWRQDFVNHLVVVTGAGGGIGSCVARTFARAGAEVVAADSSAQLLEQLEGLLADEALGCRPTVAPVDSEEGVEDLVRFVSSVRGRAVSHLVNAAGITAHSPSAEQPLADWEGVLRTNLTGTFLTCRALAPLLMRAGGEATVVNVASELAFSAEPGKAAYIASKAGVVGLTKVLGLEWAPLGVRVNAVAPGATRTPMIAAMLDQPGVRDAYLSRVPAHRFAEPEDIAQAIAFLSSPAAAHVVGQTLVVDGGYTIG